MTSISRNVSYFIITGRDAEVFKVSTVKKNADGSFESDVSWTPTAADIGQRILCASAVDTLG